VAQPGLENKPEVLWASANATWRSARNCRACEAESPVHCGPLAPMFLRGGAERIAAQMF